MRLSIVFAVLMSLLASSGVAEARSHHGRKSHAASKKKNKRHHARAKHAKHRSHR